MESKPPCNDGNWRVSLIRRAAKQDSPDRPNKPEKLTARYALRVVRGGIVRSKGRGRMGKGKLNFMS